MNNTKKIFINEEIFGQKNLLTITGKIEISISRASNYIVSELIFISFTNVYDTSSTVTMKLKGIDIYNLSSAIGEIIRTGKSEYKKFTDSSKSKESEANNKKFISLAIDKDGKLNINLVMDESTVPNSFKIISRVQFEKYESEGIIKTLESFMNEYKKYYYKCQRAYEKQNIKNKNINEEK
ncbi:hypothetical protein ACNSOL_12225 (plasmid) [Aliarcobacter lanthieri]|uniref:hypothetical protein n=1 Tax=Aliarcobacter lanthieri TaxID=1355374 RepID=UPI003AB0D00B